MEKKTEDIRENLEGYVVDIACLRTIPSAQIPDKARTHTTACALMGHCIESGYGLVDNNDKITLLDPKATKHVVETLMKTSKEKGARLHVVRERKGGGMETVSVREVVGQ
ncbi:hypothetical protein [Pontibacter actiniarum]|uniref:Uncharacterized protein n=1 Tax=Pontibacter actiniarum TaxID=323450 RepID=A0A1X9YZ53_9BACT|nr:hypothetical protein [Pontibacter actiniarum]ARS38139.1 hypothetical protein CA264_21585 [Pontibacter actiniarum]MDX5420245.1 hypothetical protein [Hymenobacteraceae bacterium]